MKPELQSVRDLTVEVLSYFSNGSVVQFLSLFSLPEALCP